MKGTTMGISAVVQAASRPRRPSWLAATVVSVAAVMGPQATAPAAAQDPSCPKVEVVFARGTFEAPGVGATGQAFVDALNARLGGDPRRRLRRELSGILGLPGRSPRRRRRRQQDSGDRSSSRLAGGAVQVRSSTRGLSARRWTAHARWYQQHPRRPRPGRLAPTGPDPATTKPATAAPADPGQVAPSANGAARSGIFAKSTAGSAHAASPQSTSVADCIAEPPT